MAVSFVLKTPDPHQPETPSEHPTPPPDMTTTPATPVPAPAPTAKKSSGVTITGGGGELAAIMAKIRKEAGDRSIIFGSQVPNSTRLPSGVFEFDLATGGGFPDNRMSIVYGPESSGKTNLALKALAQAQRQPPPCNKAVFVDLEGTFDPSWAKQVGVDVDELIVVKPSYGEQAVDMIDALVRADDVRALAVDSIAVLVAAKELDGSVEKADVGTAAILVKRLSNKLAISLSEEQKRNHVVSVILLNQTRFKIGVMFGDPETQPGGQTVKFNASLIVRLYGKNKLVKEISAGVPAFKETNATIKKAKVGITQAAFSYDLCMLAHDGLEVGETDSFNAVKGYLQACGLLVKDKGGWKLYGVTYPTLNVLCDTYRAEPDFAQRIHKDIVKAQSLQLVAPDSEPSEAPDNGNP